MFENPRVIKKLEEIETKGKGHRVRGIKLCDGSEILSNWVFEKSIHSFCLGQHVYIFKEGSTLRAVSWVEPAGKLLKVPPCQSSELCNKMDEAAMVISGDVYTWAEVQPGDGVVLLLYPTKEWIQDLTIQSSGCGKPPR